MVWITDCQSLLRPCFTIPKYLSRNVLKQMGFISLNLLRKRNMMRVFIKFVYVSFVRLRGIVRALRSFIKQRRKTLKIRSLDRAAFFLVFGGILVEIHGDYPNNLFEVSAKPWLLWYERFGGWVPYNVFCNHRKKLKRKSRKKAGLPERFIGGRHTGFKLGDLLARPFNKYG